MQRNYKLTVEECSRWASLFECIMIFDKECKKRGLNVSTDPKIFNKLKPNIINDYITNRSPEIEKAIVEKKNGFFVFDL